MANVSQSCACLSVCFAQIDDVVEWFTVFWGNRTTIEKIFLSSVAFLLFAGYTGLDGGTPKKLAGKHVEEVSDDKNVKVYFDIERWLFADKIAGLGFMLK